MGYENICILGGSGFVGSELCNLLAGKQCRIRVLSRHRERHKHLLVLPHVEVVQTDVHDARELSRHCAGMDTVVNLVGILNERGRDGSGFRYAHVELAKKVVQACQERGVRRLLHMSALHADAEEGASHYLRTKGEAENLVHAAASEHLTVSSFRPSVIFGPHDSFFNRFAGLLKLAPWVFPLACPDSRFAPVYVRDVARAFCRALEEKATCGQRFDLCGPETYTLKQLVEYTAQTLGLRRVVFGLGPLSSRLQARIMEWLPGKPFSYDNFQSLSIDSICLEDGLGRLGIVPTAMHAVVPQYLAHKNVKGRYRRYRAQARRSL